MIPFLGSLKYRNDVLERCSVSTGGGMLGGGREVTLRRNTDGSAVLVLKTRETHADREITTTYRTDDGAFDRVRALVNRYGLYRASRRPYSKIRVLDADTTTISFSFESGYFDVSEEKVLSVKMRNGFREVIRYLESLAVGEGVTTVEPQKGVLYLRSGYTLQFTVEDAFDGRLDDILSVPREVSAFEDSGIVLVAGEAPDLSGAEPTAAVESGSIVYDAESGQIILLYAAHTFAQPAYLLASIVGDPETAAALIAEMEGEYQLYLN